MCSIKVQLCLLTKKVWSLAVSFSFDYEVSGFELQTVALLWTSGHEATPLNHRTDPISNNVTSTYDSIKAFVSFKLHKSGKMSSALTLLKCLQNWNEPERVLGTVSSGSGCERMSPQPIKCRLKHWRFWNGCDLRSPHRSKRIVDNRVHHALRHAKRAHVVPKRNRAASLACDWKIVTSPMHGAL